MRDQFTDQQKMQEIAKDKLADLGLDIDVKQSMKELTLPEQRIVEIARAMVGNAKILIMDEPTAADKQGSKTLLKHLRKQEEAR